MNIPIEQCVSARPYKSAPERRIILTSILVILYAIAIPYCYMTSGEPRKIAMIHAQKLADEKWEKESSTANYEFSNTTSSLLNSVTNAINNNITEKLTTQTVPDTVQQPIITTGTSADDLFTHTDTDAAANTAAAAAKSKNIFDGWFGPTKEQRKAQQEFENWQKSFREKIPEEGISLPSKYLPSAWACLLLLSSMCLHALFHLLCHWLVSFKAMTLFKPAAKVDEHSYILVVPPPNRGKSEFVKMRRSAISGTLQLEFQRQTYVYTSAAKLGTESRRYPNGVFTLYQAPTNLPLSHYIHSRGLSNEAEVEQTLERWGKNHLSVHVASFLELLQRQLLSPLAIFQVFCALLWLLDEYWTYTLWSLVSVVIFESTSVFQRTRTQAMLGGMAPKATPVYVYRNNKWILITTKDLLPGDLFSIAYQIRQATTNSSTAVTKNGTAASGGGGGVASSIHPTALSDIVPCDCLLLSGSAIVNEASLTGESVPQMKEAITAEDGDNSINNNTITNDNNHKKTLDMNGMHRVHTLFSGTSIITIRSVDGDTTTTATDSSNSTNITSMNGISPPPDNGALAYVLRTGFSSSQGALLQMIEYSQQAVTGDSKEIGMALLLLFFFAILASAYVLKEGLRKKEKTTHEILLKCVIIVTSVVPKELPMQMAMAVNMAMMALTKAGIFCTEPHRVPLAGKITHCLFDKTGTLTTDQLVPVGIIHPHHTDGTSNGSGITSGPELQSVSSAVSETAIILAACHSLVVVEPVAAAPTTSNDDTEVDTDAAAGTGAKKTPPAPTPSTTPPTQPLPVTLVGDPIEVAAIKGVEWSWDATASTASPGTYQTLERAVSLLQTKVNELKREINNASNSNVDPQQLQQQQQSSSQVLLLDRFTKELSVAQNQLSQAQSKAQANVFQRVTVVQRYHFSSQLQRMSVLCKCYKTVATAAATNNNNNSSNSSTDGGEWYAFVKGSPEAIHTLLLPTQTPHWYKSTYESLARRGLRVLALAYKKIHMSSSSNGSSDSSVIMTDKHRSRDMARSVVESELCFGGFIAFECKTRADSKVVVQALQQSGHKVAMLTGDSLLTSLHVAKQVSICEPQSRTLILSSTTPATDDTAASDTPCWLLRNDVTDKDEVIPFDIPSMSSLLNQPKSQDQYDLLTTEAELLAVIKATGGAHSELWHYIDYFKVFARMSPPGKATIIRAIQNPYFQLEDSEQHHQEHSSDSSSEGKSNNNTKQNRPRRHYNTTTDAHVLMCGDGGNDVGALKQANVGLALLAGHANTNTTDDVIASTTTTSTTGAADISKVTTTTAVTKATAATTNGKSQLSAEDSLNAHEKALQQRGAVFNAQRAAHMKEYQAKYQKRAQLQLTQDIQDLTAQGEMLKIWNLTKENAVTMRRAMEIENRRYMAVHGHIWDPADGDGLGGGPAAAAGASGLQGLMAQLEAAGSGDGSGADGGMGANTLPTLRPGDASVAAPFTSRTPSVRSVIDLIRQGRCTLLSALMQQQIMMLESIISAYTLSALSLHNARSSERQMMASQWLIMIAAVSFSYASPLDHMHPLRPLKSLFHPAILLSILGQAAIHITCMTLAVHWATEAMGVDKLKEVTEFFKRVKTNEIDKYSGCGEDDFMCQMQAYWSAPFLPNLLNSVVFLVQTSMMISVFFTNYKGRPWMKSMLENHFLFLSVFLCVGGVIAASWEFFPKLNEMIQLTPFPDDFFRYKVIALVTGCIAGTFLWDRLCVVIFSPAHFQAIWIEFKKTTLADFAPIVKTIGKIAAGLLILGTGNILVIGGAVYAYRQYIMKPNNSVIPTAATGGLS